MVFTVASHTTPILDMHYLSNRRSYKQEQVKVQCSSPLYTHPPESGEGFELPLMGRLRRAFRCLLQSSGSSGHS
jgi:hypothetical protein